MLNAYNSRALLGAAFAIGALSLVGCSTPRTKVTEQWKDPTYAAGPMHKVAVLAQNTPSGDRKRIEDEFVDELEDEDVDAVSAYKVIGENQTDADIARSMLKSRGYDAVLVVTVERAEETITTRPQQNYYSAPFGSPSDMYSSPRLMTEYTLHVDTGLWDLRDGKRVWGSKASVENASYGSFASRVSKKVVSEVAKQNLLAPTK